ncbi:MAG TPA: cupin domain-containing protein [Thiobacillaceae bacterium]|nr:cupin domain-containing protein [Thiobacillaceae bacterium]
MSIPHAAPGESMDIRPLGAKLHQTTSSTLLREDHLEVFRFVLPAGRVVPEHRASGALTIQCLEGEVELEAYGQRQIFRPGSLVYLGDAEPHTVRALEDSSLLVTLMLRRV